MKPRILVAVLIFGGMQICFAQSKKTLAVLDFTNNSLFHKEDVAPLAKGLAVMFNTELANFAGLQLVERADLNAVIEEMKLAQAGLIDPASAQQVGKLLGAQILLLGSYMYLPKEKLRIDARLIEVETGRNLQAAEITGKTDDILQLVAKLGKKLSAGLAITISSQEIKKLEAVENARFAAVMFYARGLVAEENGNNDQAIIFYQKALQRDQNMRLAARGLARLQNQ